MVVSVVEFGALCPKHSFLSLWKEVCMTKTWRVVIIALVCVVWCGSLAMAGGGATPDDPIKWSQPPDMLDGYDVLSNSDSDTLAATDWICPDGLPITDIHWWGSYLDNDVNAKPDSFTLTIYGDVAAGVDRDWSHPDDNVLWQKTVDFVDTNEDLYGFQMRTGHDGFLYSVYLDYGERFAQDQGVVYWLSIQATGSANWGWKTASEVWNDAAVTYDGTHVDGPWLELIDPVSGLSRDLAFELTTIPEPATMALLGTVALGAIAYRRKRS